MAEGATYAAVRAAASPGFFPSLTGAIIAIAQSLAATAFMLGGTNAKKRLEETEARLAATPICCRERLDVMSARSSRVLHRNLRETPRRRSARRHMADSRRRPPRARRLRGAAVPASGTSIRELSTRWRSRRRNSSIAIQVSLFVRARRGARRSSRRRRARRTGYAITSAAARKRSSFDSSWRGNICRERRAARQRFIARRRAITATRWELSRGWQRVAARTLLAAAVVRLSAM